MKILIRAMLILLSLSAYQWAFASDEDALSYYRQAESAFEDQDYVKAKALYKKAIGEHRSDGSIDISSGERYVWKETPRGMKRVKSGGDIVSHSYYPNAGLAKIEAIEQQKLQRRLAAEAELNRLNKNVDERRKKFANPPLLTASVDLIEDVDDKIIDADEKAKLIFAIENSGGYAASNVKLRLIHSGKLIQQTEFDIGHVAPGEIKTTVVPIIGSKKLKNGKDNIKIEIVEVDGFDADPQSIQLVTRAYQPPRLKIAHPSIKSTGKRMLKAEYTVMNAGSGKAYNVVAHLELGDASAIFVADESHLSINLGVLLPNDSKNISFGFFTNNRMKSGNKLPISIRLENRESKYNITQSLGLIMPTKESRSSVAQGWNTPSHVAVPTTVANVDVDIPKGKIKRPHAIALVIGNSQYDHLPPVKFAGNDARVMRDYLITTMGYSKNQVKFIENMTYPEFNRWFGTKRNQYKGNLNKLVTLEMKRTKKPEVFIYYAGHGAPSLNNHKAYLIARNTDLTLLESGAAYSLDDFYSSIKALKTDNITVVLDACFSGNADSGPLYQDISPAALKSSSIKPSSVKNITVMASASENEVSYWYPEARHSLFTYYFLKGLRGAADNNKDKKITSGELLEYVEYGVGRYTLDNSKSSNQTPQIYGLKNRVLTQFR